MNEQSMNSGQASPNRPRCFIVTVGTSLLGQYLSPPQGSPPRVNWTIRTLEGDGGGEPCDVRIYHQQKMQNQTSKYKQAFDALKKKIESFQNQKHLQQASAELNSLYHMDPLPGKFPQDVVILIATRTPTGCLCVTALEQIFRAPPDGLPKVGQVCIKQPQGLGLANDRKFAQAGLRSFLGMLSQYIQQYQETYEVILVPTGGYKSLIPYATLAGMFHGVPVKYIYEDSDVLLELPPVPVGLDMEQWQAGALILNQISRLTPEQAEAWRASLKPGFSSLIQYDEANGTGAPELSGLGIWLMKRYEEHKHRTRLQAQTGHQAILRFLKREGEKPDLEDFFQQLVTIGPYLWTGDKIPEMVDHGPYHHTNLFSMADLMLVPILHKYGDQFMTPEEVFIFLCVVYFHDCGHVLPSFPDGRVLLPSQVREYHHILGYERLKETEWQKTLLANGLKWADSPKDLWDRYLKVMATIAMYHRRKMPLQSGKYPCYAQRENGSPKPYPPLKEFAGALQFEDACFHKDQAVFLAALFRILDGLDNQEARTGTPRELALKAAAVDTDAKAYERHAEEVLTLLGNDDTQNQAKQFVDTVMSSNEDVDQLITEKAKALSKDERVLRLYLEAATRAAFKRRQGEHYLEHLILDTPEIIATPAARNGDCHTIKVTLRAIPKSRFEHYRAAYGKYAPDGTSKCYSRTIDDVTNKIKSECAVGTGVPAILEQRKLKIEYWLRKEHETPQQLNHDAGA